MSATPDCSSAHNVTLLLNHLRAGDRDSLDQLMPLVYDELRQLAASQLHRERGNHTLQATALVHEAWLRLVGQHSVDWQNRAHFFSIAAEMMRRILVNYANHRHADKRGGHVPKLSLEEAANFAAEREIDLILLDEALTRLAVFDPRQARIVEMRYFGGLTVEEVAEVLEISTPTVKREWRMAKAWLHSQISGSELQLGAKPERETRP